MSGAYYNEHDPFAAAWLRQLIKSGHIAPGEVDERSIEDVVPIDLAGFTQCHFFAGIGIWSHSLRKAGWPDNRPVWTGSCPCQPFSAAGKGAGFADERHLWPAFYHLILHAKPLAVPVFGEQVASKDGLAWLDLVAADLEGAGYAFGAVDTCAAGFGAPHIRQRLYWVADSVSAGRAERRSWPGSGQASGCGCVGRLADTTHQQHDGAGDERPRRGAEHPDSGAHGRLAHPGGEGLPLCECQDLCGERWGEEGRAAQQCGGASGGLDDAECDGRREVGNHDAEHDGQLAYADGNPCGLANTVDSAKHGSEPRATLRLNAEGAGTMQAGPGHPGPTNGQWGAADWLLCRDGKWRPVEPAFKQMVDGLAIVLGYLRSCGENEKVKEAINATATSPHAREVLRDMREAASAEAVWLQVGGQIGFHAASILFSFLLEHQGKLGSFIDSAKKGGAEECARVLRALRQDGATPCPSRRYEYSQQFRRQFEDFMSELPQTGSLEILESLNGFPLAHGAPARVGRLRGYGNAIVAPQAEEFVRAYMEVCNEKMEVACGEPEAETKGV